MGGLKCGSLLVLMEGGRVGCPHGLVDQLDTITIFPVLEQLSAKMDPSWLSTTRRYVCIRTENP